MSSSAKRIWRSRWDTSDKPSRSLCGSAKTGIGDAECCCRRLERKAPPQQADAGVGRERTELAGALPAAASLFAMGDMNASPDGLATDPIAPAVGTLLGGDRAEPTPPSVGNALVGVEETSDTPERSGAPLGDGCGSSADDIVDDSLSWTSPREASEPRNERESSRFAELDAWLESGPQLSADSGCRVSAGRGRGGESTCDLKNDEDDFLEPKWAPRSASCGFSGSNVSAAAKFGPRSVGMGAGFMCAIMSMSSSKRTIVFPAAKEPAEAVSLVLALAATLPCLFSACLPASDKPRLATSANALSMSGKFTRLSSRNGSIAGRRRRADRHKDTTVRQERREAGRHSRSRQTLLFSVFAVAGERL